MLDPSDPRLRHLHEPAARRHHHETRGRVMPPFWLHDRFDLFRGTRSAVRRGDVRPLILAVLQRQPMHGYQVIQELEAQSGGRWRPSAGSVYPTLQQLEDEGLVRSEEVDGRRVYALTEAGRSAAESAPPARPRWAEASDSTDLRGLLGPLIAAVVQVNRAGSPRARDEARDVLVDARRRMYRILAEDTGEATAGGVAGEAQPDGEGPAAGQPGG